MVAEAGALRRSIVDGSSGADAVAAESARVGSMLVLLTTITGVLPDDTYLTALSVRQRAVSISGRSASATRLLPLIAADPSLRNVALSAPITRADGPRGDAFSIKAEFGS